jgi:predicted methyltransferase
MFGSARFYAAAIVLFTASGSAHAQTRNGGGLPPRDEWQRVPEILSAMGNIEGKRVADVAAGQGYLTRPLSRKVGPTGRVFAVEIGEVERRALEKLASDSFPNIEVIAGADTTPNLPDAIDAVVVLNSYHEFTKYRAMLESIKRALRPGGRLVLVDNDGFAAEQPRDWQASHHGLDPRFVDDELKAAGFEIIDRQDKFIVQPFPQWLFVARRPLK